MNEELIKAAVKNLQLLTIKLHEATLERKNDLSDNQLEEKFVFQYMKNIKANIVDAEDDNKNKIKILRAFPKFGVRAIPQRETEAVEPLFTIEAVFKADYVVKKLPKNDALNEFLQYNVIHNVWPFWRQHVFDIAARSGLPDIIIPLNEFKIGVRNQRSM